MKTKQIQIGESQYRIGQFTARVGSWILKQILTHAINMSEDDFANLQTHCLQVCQRMDAHGIPMPLMTGDGRWAYPELEYDLVTVSKLMKEALEFNLTPFFEDPEVRTQLDKLGLRSSLPSLPN